MAGAFYGRQLNHPKEKPMKRPVSESYVIGIDISENGDTSVLTVSRLEGSKVTVVNSFMGEEAEWMYEHLTNQKVGVLKWTPQNEPGDEKNA